MDQVTQQNAALVEQSAAAAESMKEQAQSLTRSVSIFKLPHGRGAATAAKSGRATGDASRPKAIARRMTPPPKVGKLQSTNKLAAVEPIRSKPKTGTDGDWTEFSSRLK